MNIAKTIYSSKNTEYDVVYTPDIVYAHRATGDLLLQLVSPIAPDLPPVPKTWPDPVGEKMKNWVRPHATAPSAKPAPHFPLIVDMPGSGWAGADGHRHVPHLVELAKAGFVCACISYRGTYRDNVVFPACLQDLKEAIRFLRANAEVFHIDADHVGLLGDSSGAQTTAIAALTEDGDERFNLGEHLDQSARVSACACIYGPMDLFNLVQDRINACKDLRPGEAPWPEGLPFEAMELFQDTYLNDPKGCLETASPICYVHTAKQVPPFLCVCGDEDEYMPLDQSLRFCDAVRDHGGQAEFIKISGAGHGWGVWSHEMLESVIAFFKAYLG